MADICQRVGTKLLLASLKNPLVRLKGYSETEMTDWVKEKFNWI